MKIRYIPYQDEYREDLFKMIRALYAEDPSGDKMNEGKIEKTIDYLQTHPERGRIMLFSDGNLIIGYSIIIYYWSNEYGGIILLLDELFVKEGCRGHRIGTGFINHLITTESELCKAIFLEVIPSNSKALKFYNSLGFEPVGHNFQKYVLNN